MALEAASAVTTIASWSPLVAGQQRLGDQTHRRSHGVERGANARVMPEVACVRPLALAVDAHGGGLDRRLLHSKMRCQGTEGLLPELVLDAAQAKRHSQLVQRVVGADQDLDLCERRVPLRCGAEGDPARE